MLGALVNVGILVGGCVTFAVRDVEAARDLTVQRVVGHEAESARVLVFSFDAGNVAFVAGNVFVECGWLLVGLLARRTRLKASVAGDLLVHFKNKLKQFEYFKPQQFATS